MKPPPKALVTGASGFVGSHLVRRLVDDGWCVHFIAREIFSESRRINTQIQRNIEHRATRAADQFGVVMRRQLKMKPAQNTPPRNGKKLLPEVRRDSPFRKRVAVKCFHKEPAPVAEEPRLDDEQAGQRCVEKLERLCACAHSQASILIRSVVTPRSQSCCVSALSMTGGPER